MTPDELEIRALIESWAVWRDAGDWDRFRTVWHDDGRMMATWWQGHYEDFIDVSREGFARGVRILHFLGGSSVELNGARAIAQTKMTISQRALVEGVLCDVVCTGRFYDFLERRTARWGLVLRQPIYERDRLDPVSPGAVPVLDAAKLAAFPEGYRHLAYLQTGIGYEIKRDMPGLMGPEVEALYARGRDWLTRGGTAAGTLATMQDAIRDALAIDRFAGLERRTIDITTTGRRSGEARRIETVFYRVHDVIYLSGVPAPRPRAWLLNLAAEPHFTFHLKAGVVADLAATATVIDDPEQRRRILGELVDEFNERRGPDSPWPQAVLDEWVAGSPLAEVSFDDEAD